MKMDERIWGKLLDLQNKGRFVFYFVGGCVRDLCYGIHSRDIDIVFEGDIDELSEALDNGPKKSNLSTISLYGDFFEFDFASPRKDDYPKQNGMPSIVGATVEEDLSRRDFTVNTGYLEFSAQSINWFKGELPGPKQIVSKLRYAHPMFENDIQNKKIRILHENSFEEDPSRLLRAVKYQIQLNLTFERDTEKLFNKALEDKRIEQLDTARYLRIMWDYFHHDNADKLLMKLDEQGLLQGERRYSDVVEKAEALKSEWASDDLDLTVVIYVTLFYGNKDQMKRLGYLLNCIVKETETILEAIESLSTEITAKKRYLAYKILYNKKVDSIACATLLHGDSEWFTLYMEALCHVKVHLTGADLIRMGILEGPLIGKLKEELLIYKLCENPDMDIEGEIRWIESAKNETGN
jgi:tRNA nucleotidyltransferase/poly(A) polymerase